MHRLVHAAVAQIRLFPEDGMYHKCGAVGLFAVGMGGGQQAGPDRTCHGAARIQHAPSAEDRIRLRAHLPEVRAGNNHLESPVIWRTDWQIQQRPHPA